MEVILLKEVANTGKLGDKVNVKPGYARNYLFPKSLAKPATKKNLEEFEKIRAELEKQEEEKINAARKNAEQIKGKTITIKHRAGEEGKLFGSVTAAQVAAVISENYIQVEKKQIKMPTGAIRTVCQETVEVVFHPNVIEEIIVIVQPEE